MSNQITNLAAGLLGVTAAVTAFGWLVHYALSDQIAEVEEKDEVEIDDQTIN